jgi:hypothetical protein
VAAVYDYTPTRERAGAFFTSPERVATSGRSSNPDVNGHKQKRPTRRTNHRQTLKYVPSCLVLTRLY